MVACRDRLNFLCQSTRHFSQKCFVRVLQQSAAMRAVSVCLVLVVVTAHTSFARVLTKCQLLKELRWYGVPEYELATCKFNTLSS
jgi:hypothetical protein